MPVKKPAMPASPTRLIRVTLVGWRGGRPSGHGPHAFPDALRPGPAFCSEVPALTADSKGAQVPLPPAHARACVAALSKVSGCGQKESNVVENVNPRGNVFSMS
jgi:hypothetical protein